MMKKYFIAIVITITLISCNNSTEKYSVVNKSDSLQELLNEKKSIINFILISLNDIENNLDSITGHQKLLCLKTETSEEIKLSVVNEINNDIKMINRMIGNNRAHIIEVNKKIRSEKRQNDSLKVHVQNLNKELLKKEAELKTIKIKLDLYKTRIINLETMMGYLAWDNMALEETVAEETAMLHTAYYIVGKRKELLNSHIIDRSGNLLGNSKSFKLNTDFNHEKFLEIDITETTNILLNCKDIEIITSHPLNSYHLEKSSGTIKSLIITDPVAFWETSKLLVIIKV